VHLLVIVQNNKMHGTCIKVKNTFLYMFWNCFM